MPSIHHRHSLHRALESVPDLQELASNTISLVIRQNATPTPTSSASSSLPSCGPHNDSPECQTPVKSSASMAIGLGVAIPCAVAFILMVVLSIRHRRVLRKEDEDSKNIDTDNDDIFPHDLPDHRAVAMKHSESTLTVDTSIIEKDLPLEPPRLGATSRTSTLTHDPFNPNNSLYRLPELSSSQRSLNNYNPFDQNPYPPSGDIYHIASPTYPSSVYNGISRPSSPASMMTNPYTNPYGNTNSSRYVSSKQALNTGSASSLSGRDLTVQTSNQSRFTEVSKRQGDQEEPKESFEQHRPEPPFKRRASYEGSSTLSVVSSHTPTTVSAPQFPAPVSATAAVHGETGNDEMHRHSHLSHIDAEQDEPHHEQKSKGVQFDAPESDDSESEPRDSSRKNLSRSDTKNFDRVKSVYKEYFPTHMRSPDQKAQMNGDFDFIPDMPLNQPSENNQSENSQTQDYSQSEIQGHYEQQQHQQQQHHQEHYDQNPEEHYDQQHDQYHQYEQNNGQYEEQYNDGQHAEYNQYNEQYNNNQYEGQHSEGQHAEYNQYNEQYDNSQYESYNEQQPIPDSFKAPPASSQVRKHNLPAIDTGVNSLPMPLTPAANRDLSSPSQASLRSNNSHFVHTHVNKIELSDLPVPHKMSDTASSIEYRRIRKNYDHGSPGSRANSPAPGAAARSIESPMIPVYNPLDNNLMYPGNDSQSSNTPLPSPAQFRQSIALMANLEFQRPKKYNIDYSDSFTNSRPASPAFPNESNGRSTPVGARAMIGIAPRVRPPSELVPSQKSQFEKLRPTMEMR